MRILTSVALVVAIVAACGRHRPLAPAAAPMAAPVTAPATSPTPPPDAFQAEVKPLLFAKCSPCHAPGGQMYGRLPFDDPGTVRSHQPGILRRIKAPEERAILERWIAAAPAN